MKKHILRCAKKDNGLVFLSYTQKIKTYIRWLGRSTGWYFVLQKPFPYFTVARFCCPYRQLLGQLWWSKFPIMSNDTYSDKIIIENIWNNYNEIKKNC